MYPRGKEREGKKTTRTGYVRTPGPAIRTAVGDRGGNGDGNEPSLPLPPCRRNKIRQEMTSDTALPQRGDGISYVPNPNLTQRNECKPPANLELPFTDLI
ncbi:MAG: hypothetical protein JWR35_3745 [Marmoricola sp.]|nr:hypothetical protein [Marmoricola sp.]